MKLGGSTCTVVFLLITHKGNMKNFKPQIQAQPRSVKRDVKEYFGHFNTF